MALVDAQWRQQAQSHSNLFAPERI